jgi:hypothetical protein
MHAGQAGVKAIEITITMRQLRLVSDSDVPICASIRASAGVTSKCSRLGAAYHLEHRELP